MNDPSDGVPPMLLQHVHLVSTNQYPYEPATMHVDKVIAYLLQAPKVVRDMQPVAWQYVSPPPGDGKVFLMWQPINKLGMQFATDGYVWEQTEQASTLSSRGYTVEAIVHEAGFNPGIEQIATHRRMRYRLVHAAPNGQQQPVDPSLEIVHYLKAFPEHQRQANQVRPDPRFQKWMSERKWLESQGALMRKSFMLHDSANWPKLGLPSAIPGNPYAQPNMAFPGGRAPPPQGQPGYGQRPGMPPNGAAGMPGNAGGMGPSPAKRQRTSNRAPAPPGMAAAMMSQPENDVILDEEMQSQGDGLDALSPRDISEVRYKQHHEWMEEIISSPYATGQIQPTALWSAFSDGDLGALTENLSTDTPDGSNPSAPAKSRQIGPAQVAELESRVKDYVKKREDEMADMRAQHARRMEDFGRQKLFANLERRLAGVPMDGSEADASLEEIVREAERETGTTLTTGESVVQVSKGGILTAEEQGAALRDHRAITPENEHVDQTMGDGDLDKEDESTINNTADNLTANPSEPAPTQAPFTNVPTQPPPAPLQPTDAPSNTDTPTDLPNPDQASGPASADVFAANDNDNDNVDFSEFANLDTAGEALEMYNDEYGSYNPT